MSEREKSEGVLEYQKHLIGLVLALGGALMAFFVQEQRPVEFLAVLVPTLALIAFLTWGLPRLVREEPLGLSIVRQKQRIVIEADGGLAEALTETTVVNHTRRFVERNHHVFECEQGCPRGVKVRAFDQQGELAPPTIVAESASKIAFYVTFRRPLEPGTPRYVYSWVIHDVNGFYDFARHQSHHWDYTPMQSVAEYSILALHPAGFRIASSTMKDLSRDRVIASPKASPGDRQEVSVSLKDLSSGTYSLVWRYAARPP